MRNSQKFFPGIETPEDFVLGEWVGMFLNLRLILFRKIKIIGGNILKNPYCRQKKVLKLSHSAEMFRRDPLCLFHIQFVGKTNYKGILLDTLKFFEKCPSTEKN